MWWIYLLGPFVALLPRRWRKALPLHDAIRWHSASVISGTFESGIALYALLYWYSLSVSTWTARVLDNAVRSAGPVEINEQEVGFAALLVWVSHPLTWVIFYFAVEGAARACAAITNTVLGLLPLYLIDRLYCKIRGIEAPVPPGTPQFAQSNAASYVDTVREHIRAARVPELPDELFSSMIGSVEVLEIRSSHAKADWDPPRVVRYEDRYYRLEECERSAGAPRSFVYKLRRLSTGVPGRTVILYSPGKSVVISSR
jgi:hypothetical protein